MNVRKIFLHVALILTSVAFVYMFSSSTSPRYDFIGSDSPIFQVIGKYWTQGYLPYVDLFDQKGSLIFFVNALGYMIHPRTGIMVPQIILMYVSSLFIWKTLELFSRGKTKIFFFALTMFYYAAHYWEGNNPDEYTIPFLSAATYFFLRTLKNSADEKFLCPPIVGFVYGLSFGGCVLLRASNAMPTCCYVFLTAIFLLQTREFKTLLKNFLSFVAGFAVIVSPFVIYFAAHGALYDALYGTILFNVSYATQGKIEYALVVRLRESAIHLMPVCLMILFGVILLARDVRNKLAWSAIFVGAMMSALLMNLRLYTHYYMMLVPIIPLLFAVAEPLQKICAEILAAPKFSWRRLSCKVLVISCAAYSCVCCLLYLPLMIKYFSPQLINDAAEIYAKEVADIRRLERLIPEDERQSFACWGNFFSTSHWILVADMLPQERFFMNNSALALLDPRQKAEWLRHVRERSTLWILYGTPKTKQKHYLPDDHRADPDVERLLAERYTLRGEILIYDQVMRLYRLKSAQ